MVLNTYQITMGYLDQIINTIGTFENRLDWEEYFMSLAFLASCRSPCERLHVGCVIVKNNRVISTGYNGFISGAPHESIIRDGHEQATIHAEQNAIADAAKRGVSIDESTMYITHYPCINCCKMICSSGIKKVIYNNDYRNDNNVETLLKHANIDIHKYSDSTFTNYAY